MSREGLIRLVGGATGPSLFEGAYVDDAIDAHAALATSLRDLLQVWDPDASLPRWLALRLSGPQVSSGRIGTVALEGVLGALQKEVLGAAPDLDPDQLSLELVGLTSGSAVVQLEPRVPLSADEPGTLGPPVDPLDGPVGTVIGLHAAAEAHGDLGSFAGHEELLRGFEALSDVLDANNIDLEMTWHRRTGELSSASLTSSGRSYARQYLVREDQVTRINVSGLVTVLDLSGSFSLKAGPSRHAARYQIRVPDSDSLLRLNLVLGAWVSVLVERHVQQDRLGLASKPTYQLVEMLSGVQEEIDSAPF